MSNVNKEKTDMSDIEELELDDLGEDNLSEGYSLKHIKTTHPDDITDDEDNPVKAVEKHYDIHHNNKKVGNLVHHYNTYGGDFFNGSIAGRKIPWDRDKGSGKSTAHSFLKSTINTKWHEKNVAKKLAEQNYDLGEDNLSEGYSLKHIKTTHPDDITDDEDNPVKAVEKHYDIHHNNKKVGNLVHHHNEYGGNFFNGSIAGRKIPWDRDKGPGKSTAHSFLKSAINSKWHEKNVAKKLAEQNYGLGEDNLSEGYSLKHTLTTHPDDVTDDEDNPVKAVEKHYDIHHNNKKVGDLVHHHNEYGGNFFGGSIAGNKIPWVRDKGPESTAHSFLKSAINSKWHEKNVAKKLANQDHNLDESAADSLKPNSNPVSDPKSKLEAITSVLGAMNSMPKEDLTKWYTQAMALIGKEADSLPSRANADSNSSSVDMKGGKGPKTRDPMPKLNVKEDVDEMFEGEELSEEFKEKATTLFEAAVGAKLTVEVAKLNEQYESRLNEELEEIYESMTSKLDGYLTYAVDTWMEENKVAIESSLRNELTGEFIDGLKNLFSEHYIDVPEEKVDMVEELSNKVSELETVLDKTISENSELKSLVLESEKNSLVENMTEDLTMTEAEKFEALAEGIEFNGDLNHYQRKLTIIKESYFGKNKVSTSNIEDENFIIEETNQNTMSSDPEINRLALAISRQVKK